MSLPQEQLGPRMCPHHKKHPRRAKGARSWLWCMVPFTGLLSLVWFLVRVVPKPSRAAYPCQRAALPLASGFVLWVIGAAGSVAAWRYAKALWRSRSRVALACAGVSAALALLSLHHMPEEMLIASFTAKQAMLANAPIGTPRGIHPGRVVWVHDATATNWLGTNDAGGNIGDGFWYQSNHTSQVVVDKMMSAAIRRLSGEATDANAWNAFFRFFNQNHGNGAAGYQPGEKICIKVNMATACRTFDPPIVDTSGNQVRQKGWINTSPQMILALLRQLVNVVGVAQADITVGDTTCYFPNHYWNYLHGEFPNVHYLATDSQWGRLGPTSSNTRVYWSTTAADPWTPDYLPVSFAEAAYVINFACLKGHSSGITVCGKNHHGSLIRTPSQAGFYNLHFSLPNAVWSPGTGRYRSIIDTMGHSQLGGKTLLYLVDGLYAGYRSEGRPYLWQMAPFNGDWPSSLFVSQDPVAIDSVGYDFLLNEWPFVVADPGLQGGAEDYLHEAALANQPPSQTVYQPDGPGHPLTASLGVHEHWNNPQDKQYSGNLQPGTGIELLRVESPSAHPADFDLDNDVDSDDSAVFEACAMGPGLPNNDSDNCWRTDLDPDKDVDQSDFGIFQRCLSGTNTTPDPACTN